jgi:Tfp pilus assembly protein FimT
MRKSMFFRKIMSKAVNSYHNTNGFSMLEIYMVFTILGITATIAVPKISGLIAKGRLRSATQQILSDVSDARMKAITYNTNSNITFNNSGYDIYLDTNRDNVFSSDEIIKSRNITQYSGVEINTYTDPIFYSNGKVTNTGNIEIKGSHGTRNININIIGRLKITRVD